MVSKALVVGAYQKKCEELSRLPDVSLRVVVPSYWREGKQRILLERRFTKGYDLVVRRMVLNGHFHLHFYPGLWRDLRQVRPELVHLDEEAYNLATAHGIWLSRRRGAKTIFFTWQNISRDLPFPFRELERYCLRNADAAIAGNNAAKDVLRRKGFSKLVEVIPQFGVDPDVYRRAGVVPAAVAGLGRADGSLPFVVGYIGRLVPAKGLQTLLEAVGGLKGDWLLLVVGDGPFKARLAQEAARSGIGDRLVLVPPVPSVSVPSYLALMDVLVLPSLTTPNWKEQFGRVLIEAMACEVPVVGSDSGEIPFVVGEAGLVFGEGRSDQLRAHLERLLESADLRLSLATKGRDRVLTCFTQRRVAEATYRFYSEVLGLTVAEQTT